MNIPTIFVSGGPMLAGHVKGDKTSLSSMFEALELTLREKLPMKISANLRARHAPHADPVRVCIRQTA